MQLITCKADDNREDDSIWDNVLDYRAKDVTEGQDGPKDRIPERPLITDLPLPALIPWA